MKKFFLGMLAAIALIGMQSCENGVAFGNINPDKLPNAAKSFIKQYFPDQTILSAEKEKDDGQIVYEATLSDGTELDFDANGEWTEVDCHFTKVPDGIVPEKIVAYVKANYANSYIVEVEHKFNRYKVELNNSEYGSASIELRFDSQLNYIGDSNPAKAIRVEQLPDTSSNFVEQFFPGIEIVYAEKDEDDGIITYELKLADGTEIEVDENGNWLEVECFRRALPAGIVPQQIVDYVAQAYPNIDIVGIEREDKGYEIKLRNGVELEFDANFNIINDTDDDIETVITFEELPADAQAFLNEMTTVGNIVTVIEKLDGNVKTYEVELTDGLEIEFDAQGAWLEIEADDNLAVPDAFVPEAIRNYVNTNYPNVKIESIDRKQNGLYEVELTNDVELYFDASYNFVGMER